MTGRLYSAYAAEAIVLPHKKKPPIGTYNFPRVTPCLISKTGKGNLLRIQKVPKR